MAPLPAQTAPPVDQGAASAAVPAPAQKSGAPRIDVSDFRGRADDVDRISQLIRQDACRLVGLVGIPGVGKTWLAVKLAEQLQGAFEQVVYRSLSDRPDPWDLVTELLTAGGLPPSPEGNLDRLCADLIQQLDRSRRLLVLDDTDHLYQTEALAGTYGPGLQGYGTFLQAIGTQAHRSCVLWVGRTWPQGLAAMGRTRCYRVRGFPPPDLALLPCWPASLVATTAQWQALHTYLGGVPKLMTPLVSRLKFAGYDLGRCLDNLTAPLPDITHYLDQWLADLSANEIAVLTELALAHQAKLPEQLLAPLDGSAMAVVESLFERGLCQLRVQDQSEVSLALPHLLGAHLCDRWLQTFPIDDPQAALQRLHDYPLLQFDAPEPIQQQQRQRLLLPLAAALGAHLPDAKDRFDWIQTQLRASRALGKQQPGHSAGNLLNLAQHWRLPLVDLDCQGLTLWGLDLQSDDWQGVVLSGSDLTQVNLAKPLGRQPVMTIGTRPSPQSVNPNPHGNANTVAVGDQSGQLLLWRPQDGRLQAGPEFDQPSPILAVAFSPSGANLAVGRQDGRVQLWGLGSSYGPEILTPEAIPPLKTLAYSPDGQVLAGGTVTGELYLWRLESGECWRQITAHTGAVTAIAFSPCGHYLTTAGQDGNAVEWDLNSGQPCHRFRGRVTAWLGTVGYRVSSDGESQAIAIGRDEGQILLWDMASSRPYRVLVEDCDTVIAVALSPDGQHLAVSDIQCTVRIWSVATRQLCHHLPPFPALVTALGFSTDSRILITGGDYTVQLWHVATGDCWRSWQSQPHPATALALVNDHQILSLHRDQTLRCWQRTAGLDHWRPHHRLWLDTPANTVAVGGRQSVWAMGDEAGTIRLWNPAAHSWLGDPLRLSGAITALALDPQGTWLAAGDSTGTVTLWHLPSQTRQWQHPAHSEPPTALVFSPGGERLFSGSRDRTIQVWRCPTDPLADAQNRVPGQPLVQLTGHLRQVHCLWAWDAGQQLLSGSQDGTVCLWDVDQQKVQCQWTAQNRLIYGVTVDDQGTPLAIAGSAQTLEVWDIRRNRHRHTLTDEDSTLWQVSLSLDGQLLLSASQTGHIHLWRVATGEHCAMFRVDRPYEAMEIQGCTGLSPVETAILQTLGAID
ncbi:MAG: AAA family ATPase [Leptolyngbya sp. RL_3_1]|nr:AAA family ATPase [Leptolyngbya sp. RL_3_1]